MSPQRPTVPRLLRLVGLIDLAFAFVCLATPEIRSHVGVPVAMLLVLALLAGAVVLFRIARRMDRSQTVALYPTVSESIGELGARRPVSSSR